MKKWEYRTEFLCANIGNIGVEEYLKRKKLRSVLLPYKPETLIPFLDARGERGWELIHIQPVATEGGGLVVFPGDEGRTTNWYLCVFKRRKRKRSVPR